MNISLREFCIQMTLREPRLKREWILELLEQFLVDCFSRVEDNRAGFSDTGDPGTLVDTNDGGEKINWLPASFCLGDQHLVL